MRNLQVANHKALVDQTGDTHLGIARDIVDHSCWVVVVDWNKVEEMQGLVKVEVVAGKRWVELECPDREWAKVLDELFRAIVVDFEDVLDVPGLPRFWP